MINSVIVRDKNRVVIGWFENNTIAISFIERNDPKGIKRFYISKI